MYHFFSQMEKLLWGGYMGNSEQKNDKMEKELSSPSSTALYPPLLSLLLNSQPSGVVLGFKTVGRKIHADLGHT